MSSGTQWRTEPSPEGARYLGPHGPMTMLRDKPKGTTVIRLAAGEARLDMDITTRDDERMEEGVPFSMPDANYVLRRDGKRLVLIGPGGLAAAARSRWLKLSIEDGSGATVAYMKGTKWEGEVLDGAAPLHVALMLAVGRSQAHVTRNRSGALLPW